MKDSQTPRRSDKGEQLSPEEFDMFKKRTEELEDRSVIPSPYEKPPSKLAVFIKNNKLTFAIASVFTIALTASLVLLLIFAVIAGNDRRDYRFYYDPNETKKNDEEEVKVDYKDAVINDVLYFDMNKLAEFAGFSISGSADTVKYIASEGQYIKFINGKDYAVINGTKVALPHPAFVSKDECLAPYSFVKSAVASGLKFKEDTKKHTVTVTRKTYVADKMTYKEAITFRYDSFVQIMSLTKDAYGS